jgi:hypothetical protein
MNTTTVKGVKVTVRVITVNTKEKKKHIKVSD